MRYCRLARFRVGRIKLNDRRIRQQSIWYYVYCSSWTGIVAALTLTNLSIFFMFQLRWGLGGAGDSAGGPRTRVGGIGPGWRGSVVSSSPDQVYCELMLYPRDGDIGFIFFLSLSLSLSRRNSKRSASWSDERAGMLIAIVRIPRVRFTVQFQVKISKVLYCDCDGDCDVFHKHTHSEWEKEGLLRSPHEIKCTTLLVKQFRQGILISTWFGFRNYVFCLATLAVCSNSSVQSRPSQQQNPPPPERK